MLLLLCCRRDTFPVHTVCSTPAVPDSARCHLIISSQLIVIFPHVLCETVPANVQFLS